MRVADAVVENEVCVVDVALMNEKVTFQKNAVVTDAIGNHVNAWEDFYSCFATIGGEGLASSKERETAGQTVEDVGMTVTVRYCRMAAEITGVGFRVILRGEIYDITNVDHMNFKKKCLKFTCRKVRR
jgi:SPP1 family predicted phage head-tail adaptor